MSDSLITLLIGLGLLSIALWVFWPEASLYARGQRGRGMNARIRREDALKHIHSCEMGSSPASIQSITGVLGIHLNEASATLSELEGYKLAQISNGGIRLTPAGSESALHILRAHRIWERYLADETGCSEQEWHDLAERYEHEMTALLALHRDGPEHHDRKLAALRELRKEYLLPGFIQMPNRFGRKGLISIDGFSPTRDSATNFPVTSCGGRKRTSVLETVLRHRMSDTITVLNSY